MSSTTYLENDFEPPLFSLGLEDTQIPSFSLGIDEVQPPTPTVDVQRENVSNEQEARTTLESSDSEDMSRRPLKRLRRGPKCNTTEDGADTPAPGFFQNLATDDIEDFSSDEDTKSLKPSTRTFSALKPVRTPPILERKGPSVSSGSPADAPHSGVAKRKTSLGSKEVKFQTDNFGTKDPPPFSTSSQVGKCKTPVYEFRDNQICIDIEEETDEEAGPADRPLGDQVAALLRQRLPHFSFIDDLQGEPVYIDYRGQFGSGGSSSMQPSGQHKASNPASLGTAAKSGRGKASGGRKKAANNRVEDITPQSNASTGKRGHWVTESGIRVYVTAEGQRLSGHHAYKRYMKDNGKLPKRNQKQKKQRRKA